MKMVLVMNKENARKYTFKMHDHRYAIISITTPGDPNIKFNDQRHCFSIKRYKFADVSKGSKDCITPEIAKDIAKFAISVQNKITVLIVHCDAGISRSAGIGAAISKYFKGNDEEFFSSHYIPNNTCYYEVLKALHAFGDISIESYEEERCKYKDTIENYYLNPDKKHSTK